MDVNEIKCKGGEDEEDFLYISAVKSLMSKDHISKTREDIERAALRRTLTLEDISQYWSTIVGTADDNKKNGLFKLPRRRIHITGTKGKGTTACYCEHLLRTKYGYQTGLFTSPHLVHIQERIRINGKPISKRMFGHIYWTLRKKLLGRTRHTNNQQKQQQQQQQQEEEDADISGKAPQLPAYFRMLTLMALYAFVHYRSSPDNQPLDVIILEVGIGGRYDATNLSALFPVDSANETVVVCGVTLLDYDHMNVLGDTLEKIAWEKGGLFLPKCHCHIMGTNDPSIIQVLQQCADEKKVSSFHIVQHNNSQHDNHIPHHLLLNWSLARSLCQSLVHHSKGQSLPSIPSYEHVLWPGRNQIVTYMDTAFYLDGAHTPQSIKSCIHWWRMAKIFQDKKKVLVFYCSHERNPVYLLQLLAMEQWDTVYFITKLRHVRPSRIAVKTALQYLKQANNPISTKIKSELLPNPSWSETLGQLWQGLNVKNIHNTQVFTDFDLNQTLQHIITTSKDSELSVGVTGSLYLVGAVLETINWTEPPATGHLNDQIIS